MRAHRSHLVALMSLIKHSCALDRPAYCQALTLLWLVLRLHNGSIVVYYTDSWSGQRIIALKINQLQIIRLDKINFKIKKNRDENTSEKSVYYANEDIAPNDKWSNKKIEDFSFLSTCILE